jgi:cysteine desulfurase / selenocysteine lyase
MTFDVARARQETPGVRRVTHLNNAGAGLCPHPVLDAMVDHLRLEAEIGGYEAAERAEPALDRTYDAAARLIGCRPDDIAVTDSASRAWGLAFYSIPLKPGDRILASSVEYGSNYLSLLHVARRTGAVVETIPNDGAGRADAAALRELVDDRVKAIVMTHVPSNSGLVNPITEIGAVARDASILYIVDACQSVGQLPIDVGQVGCDFLVGSGRKYLRGPRGTGFLYARKDVLSRIDIPQIGLDGARWLDGTRYELATDANLFETWETNTAAKIGLGVAIDYALDWGIDQTWPRTRELADYLRQCLASVPTAEIVDPGVERCGIVSLLLHGREPRQVRLELAKHGVNVWTCLRNSACADMESRGLSSVLRASVHYYNTAEEIDHFCRLLRKI